EDRFEDMGLGFQKCLRAGFLELAEQHPDRCCIIDGGQSIEAVERAILHAYTRVTS
ncbi:MAG: thymidylate kinase, partial [Proteobacteria bacterium]|nr:thymidylate kinase [Pseudomonadota bacterium]